MSAHQAIKRYILENYLFTTDAAALGDRDSLLEKGVVDSTGVLELVMFLEQEFGICVQDDELTPENLDSVEAIAAFVAAKRTPDGRVQGAGS